MAEERSVPSADPAVAGKLGSSASAALPLASALQGSTAETTSAPQPSAVAPSLASALPFPDQLIRFRLSHIDDIMSYDDSEFDNRLTPFSDKPLHAVPVIRVFGATDRGQRACVHIHGVFPYVYIDYKGKDLDPDTVNAYIYKLGRALNHAMTLSFPPKNNKKSQTQFISFIVICKGVNFYGYHVGHQPFLKIYGVNPRFTKRLSQLLRSGAIFNTQFDVFEDHIPYRLQFLLDSNLFGCGWVDVSHHVKFREGVPEHEPSPSDEYNPPTCDGPFASRIYTSRTVSPDLIASSPPKISYAPLELDIPVSSILNRRRLTENDIHNNFEVDLVSIGRAVPSVKELWLDETRRRAARGEEGPFEVKDQAPRDYDHRKPDAPHFDREPEFRVKMAKRQVADFLAWKQQCGGRGKEPTFGTFVAEKEKAEGRKSGWLDKIGTTFQQTSAVYRERFEEDEQLKYPFGAWAVKGYGLNVSKEDEEKWTRAGSVGVDLGKLQASNAANLRMRAINRQKMKEERKFKGEGGFDDDDDDEGDSDEEGPAERELGENSSAFAADAPATQPYRFAQSQRRMDRNEERGREGNADAAYQDDVEEEEDDEFWGLKFDIASRAASEASSGGNDSDDEHSSVGSRPASAVGQVSPTKSGRGSSSKQQDHYAEFSSPSKRQRTEQEQRWVEDLVSQGGGFGQQAASFLVSPSEPTLAPSSTRPRSSGSPTVVRPAQSRETSVSVTPSRRARSNPFSSPDKAVAVRVARKAMPSPIPRLAVPAEEEPPAALFDFHMPIEQDVQAPQQDEPAHTMRPQGSPPTNRTPAPLEDFLRSSAESQDRQSPTPPPFHPELTPSQALAELKDLPDGVFDEEYQPTPTIKEEVPSQLPDHLRSSSDFRFVSAASDDEEEKPKVGQLYPPKLPQHLQADDVNDDMEDVKPNAAPPMKKKHVMFQLSRSNSEASTSDSGSQATTPTAIKSPAGSNEVEEVRTSQSPNESDSATAPVPPARIPSDFPLSRHSFTFTRPPPTTQELLEDLARAKFPKVVYQAPFYSKPTDVPRRRQREYGGKSFDNKASTIKFLPPFRHGGRPLRDPNQTDLSRARKVKTWEFVPLPPSSAEVQAWLVKNGLEEAKKPRFDPTRTQIEAATQKKTSDKFTATKGAAVREPQHMAVLAMEVHANTRANPARPGKHFLPNPEHDAIEVLFYCLQSDNDDLLVNGRSERTHVGVIVVGDEREVQARLGNPSYVVEVVENEHDLIMLFVDKVRFEWDPECLAGFEVHHSSWGYLLERAEYAYDWNLVPELGRVKSFDTGKFGNAQSDRWGFNQASTLNFTGRHVLPVFRILKSDNKFQQNSFEHLAFHTLGERTVHWSYRTLTEWYTSGDCSLVSRVVQYWRNRCEMNIEMLDAAEVIEQNCESARVFGVDFNSVRTRGSQFKVESVMFKIAKPESFLLLSPNRQQVGQQNAAEMQPLIKEPKSGYYKDPLLVLDFQSLYPSVMIAYNYCYSTCLGRVEDYQGWWKLGVSESDLPDGLLHLLKDDITISPNGIVFVKPNIRKSLLAKMLSDLLDTRVMVKESMKAVEADKALTKLLNARQLALKFLANVTYGYTSATFSGRMPLVEVADSIVQTGRETLEKVIKLIDATEKWGAKVVYGDTDSVFVHLPGKSKDEAFDIGYDIADTVTSMNPRPIKLKFEKVYLGSFLLAKKRYVGYKYEKKSQVLPDFDAKGIETVRRDGCPAVQKIQEWCLKDFFTHADISRIKEYILRQFRKLDAGDVSPQDFVIAKKVRLGSYAEGRAPPPGVAVAARAMNLDTRAEPEYGERVPYVIFQASTPGLKQIDRAIAPGDFLADPRFRLDARHYIERMILPPMDRLFSLVGVDVKSWYKEMAKAKKVLKNVSKDGVKPIMLDEHFSSDSCVACRGPNGYGGLCPECRSNPAEAVYTLEARKQALRLRQHALHRICVSCSDNPMHNPIACESLDCPNLYARVKNENELAKLVDLEDLIF
ncbi:hypothetical protein JCM11251_002064 [Rhodosporidiobolus azoricus]